MLKVFRPFQSVIELVKLAHEALKELYVLHSCEYNKKVATHIMNILYDKLLRMFDDVTIGINDICIYGVGQVFISI